MRSNSLLILLISIILPAGFVFLFFNKLSFENLFLFTTLLLLLHIAAIVFNFLGSNLLLKIVGSSCTIFFLLANIFSDSDKYRIIWFICSTVFYLIFFIDSVYNCLVKYKICKPIAGIDKY